MTEIPEDKSKLTISTVGAMTTTTTVTTPRYTRKLRTESNIITTSAASTLIPTTTASTISFPVTTSVVRTLPSISVGIRNCMLLTVYL